MVVMAKSNVLDRVAADLAGGRTQPAIQRLGSLVAAHPTDLDLRQRLSAVHRLVGNRIEAGRWGYLNAEADPADTGAFERAFPSPAVRLRKLRWPAREAHAATDFARARLAELASVTEPTRAPRPARIPWTTRSPWTTRTPRTTRSPRTTRPTLAAGADGAGIGRAWWAGAPEGRARYLVAATAAAVPFAALGAVTVIQWIVG